MAEGGGRDSLDERLVIREGEKISDLIVDGYRAYKEFKQCYDDFAANRAESQSLCKQITEAIESSTKRTDKIRNIIESIERAERSVQAIPDPQWSWLYSIGAAVSTVVLKTVGYSHSEEDITKVKFEILRVFQRDTHSSSQVYLKGVECTSKFEETCRAIKSLHRRVQNQERLNATIEDKFVLEFLKKISEYNPSNASVYPVVLRRAYERLIENTASEDGRRLTKVFEVIPDAVTVINLLKWRFNSDGYDSRMTQDLRKKILDYFTTDTYNRGEFLHDIGNCYSVSEKERVILQKTMWHLLNMRK